MAQINAMEKPAIEPSVVNLWFTELKDFQKDVDGHENEVEEIRTATHAVADEFVDSGVGNYCHTHLL